jgi:hypothetical protein
VVGALTPAVSTILARALGGALGKALQNKNQPASVRRIREESCLVFFLETIDAARIIYIYKKGKTMQLENTP